MTPEQRVEAFLATLRRRVAARHAFGAAAAGCTAAAGAFASAGPLRLAERGLNVQVAAVLLGLAGAVVLLLLLRAYGRDPVATVEARVPGLRNLLFTARELLHPATRVRPYARDAVMRDAAGVLDAVRPAGVLPLWPFAAAAAAGIALLAAATLHDRVPVTRRGAQQAAADQRVRHAGIERIDVTIVPPSYTGLPPRTVRDPDRIEALAGSRLDLDIRANGAVTLVDELGRSRALAGGRGRYTAAHTVVRDSVLALQDARAGGRVLLPVVAVQDRPPEVEIKAPGRDLTFADGAARVRVQVEAHDDLALGQLRFRYTKVSGSGENFEFKEGELPLRIARAGDRQWTGTVELRLPDFALQPGDQVVYRALARDRRPGAPAASSDAFIVQIAQSGTMVGGGFSLPEERDKMALSQQMVIVLTERLHARRGTMPAEAFAEEALGLAAAQRMVRSEFIFMMGGEVADEMEEAAHGHEIAEGRLENAAARDMLAATRFMARAETDLTGSDTGAALAVEREALKALQRAFDRRRYIVRTIGGRTEIDPARRLTGELKDADPAGRRTAVTDVDPRVDEMRAVMRALQVPTVEAARAALAERVLRLDPRSDDLRSAAGGLLACALPCADARDAAAAAVQARLQRASGAVAGAARPEVDLALRGALADAMRARRSP